VYSKCKVCQASVKSFKRSRARQQTGGSECKETSKGKRGGSAGYKCSEQLCSKTSGRRRKAKESKDSKYKNAKPSPHEVDPTLKKDISQDSKVDYLVRWKGWLHRVYLVNI